jgi:hypothetical protein
MTTGAQAGKAHVSKDGRTALVSITVSFLHVTSRNGTMVARPAR